MTTKQKNKLYYDLVQLCQQYGFTTQATYEALQNAVESIKEDDTE